jgi:uncharacterized membrane protein YebE (DUF533 family)
MDFIKAHAKSLTASAFAIGTLVQTAISDGVITTPERYAIGTAILTAVLVYLVPNKASPPAA